MKKREYRFILFAVMLFWIIATGACNRSSVKINEVPPTPTVTMTPTPNPTTSPVPTATSKPTVTPVPIKENLLAMSWFDECKMIDCEEYYFEVLSFIERSVGGYAIETVFENRQQFAVYIGISDVHINFLCQPINYWPVDWNGIMIGPGKKETIEFWVPDYYAEQLGITRVEDFNCASFNLSVWAVSNIYFDYNDFEEIIFYRYGRENVVPYEHFLEVDDVALVDREDVKLYVTDFEYDDDGNYIVHFYWENNTTHILYHSFYNESLNGYMCSSFYYEGITLGPGTSAYEYIRFTASDLEECGITSVTEIEFDVRLYYDAHIWQWEDLVKDTFCVYPLGPEAVQKQEREPQDTDIVLFDTEEYKMIITGFSLERSRVLESVYTEYIIHAYVENRTDHSLQFVANDAIFNGEEYTSYYNYDSVSPGKNRYIELSWKDRDKMIENYPNLESFELTVQIENLDEEKRSVLFEERFTVIPR